MDVEAASDQLDALIEKRTAERDGANAEEELWKASARKHNAKLRRQHRAEWYGFYCRLADSLRASAERYERRAEELLETDLRKETV